MVGEYGTKTLAGGQEGDELHQLSIGKVDRLGDFKPQAYTDVRQLASDGDGFVSVKAELDEYAAVTQEFRCEVLLPNGAKKHNAGHRKQTSCREGPRAGSWPPQVVAANNDRMGVVGLKKLNVSNEFCNIRVVLDAMDANHLHGGRDVAR